MTWYVWWWYLVTETALSIVPGPAVLFVVSQGLRAGGWRGLWAALGIVSANVVWFALSAVGVGAAILASGSWFLAIKWLGAGYLVYLALRAVVGHATLHPLTQSEQAPPIGAARMWTRGVILQLTNPKALVFFVALLPQFIDPAGPIGLQILILGVTSVVTEFPVLAVYALLAGRASTLAREHRFARIADLVAAALLIGAALSVLLGPADGNASAHEHAFESQANSTTAP
jgi:threonine/homoserine/homoserine lactone efflux protein